MHTTALVLGSGSARGTSEIGDIKALQEENIPIDIVIGCSMGGVVGVMYAAGVLDKYEEFVLSLTDHKKIKKYLDPVIPTQGIFDGKKIIKQIQSLLPCKNIEDLSKPYVTVATDLESGRQVWFSKGDIGEAIRCSMAIPGVFTPIKHKGRYLVDGGIVNPLPINIARAMGAKVVIAVDVNHKILENTEEIFEIKEERKDHEKASHHLFSPIHPNILDILENTLFMMEDQITKKNLELHPPDILIQPMMKYVDLFDFQKSKELIEEGYSKMKHQMPKLKKMLNKLKSKS